MTLLAPAAAALGDLEPPAGPEGALLARCLERLRDAAGEADDPACAFFVPGRVEVLGKHTDYAGGRSLLAAVERGAAVAAVARRDRVLRVTEATSGRTVAVALGGEGGAGGEGGPAAAGGRRRAAGVAPEAPEPGWARYPRAVALRVGRDFPGPGADVAFAGDLPPAAGLSSSSALVVGLGLALATASGRARSAAWTDRIPTPAALADYLAAVESGAPFGDLAGDAGVGTRGGSEDHAALLLARPGALVRCRFRPTELEDVVPLPPGHAFVVAVSGVRAAKAAGARASYNRASDRAALLERTAAELTGRDGPLARALEADPGLAAALAGRLRARHPEEASGLVARLEQLHAESAEIVPAAAAALASGDLAGFGRLVDRSQRLAEEALANQVPETTWLARAAREEGAVAASAFGAGFGGSVWALVPEEAAPGFARRWREGYGARFSGPAGRATFVVTGAAPPARRLA